LQVSLEDRIAELNKQHSEAQRRLQSLVARRRNGRRCIGIATRSTLVSSPPPGFCC